MSSNRLFYPPSTLQHSRKVSRRLVSKRWRPQSYVVTCRCCWFFLCWMAAGNYRVFTFALCVQLEYTERDGRALCTMVKTPLSTSSRDCANDARGTRLQILCCTLYIRKSTFTSCMTCESIILCAFKTSSPSVVNGKKQLWITLTSSMGYAHMNHYATYACWLKP